MAYSSKTMAEGCFGKVYKEKHKDTWAAMKRVPVDRISSQEMDRECRVYHNARHPNVVKLLDNPWIKDSKKTLLHTEVYKPPVVNYQQDPPQQTEMEKALVSFKGAGLSNQMALMSLSPTLSTFPFPILDSGKMIHQRYTAEEGSVEHKEIITSGGKITKFERVEYSFKHSEKNQFNNC